MKTSRVTRQRPVVGAPGFRPATVWIGALATILTLAASLAPAAEAASVYANWLKVKRITYAANLDTYLVLFDGTPRTNETDDFGNPCDSYTQGVVRASSAGVPTDAAKVDRLMTELHIAFATGKLVRAWAAKCDVYSGTTYPKIYSLQTGF
jgi:hypothetical protein